MVPGRPLNPVGATDYSSQWTGRCFRKWFSAPVQHQAFLWTNMRSSFAFSEIWIKFQNVFCVFYLYFVLFCLFVFLREIHLKMSSAKYQPFCWGFHTLTGWNLPMFWSKSIPCLFNHLFRRTSKKTSKLCHTGRDTGPLWGGSTGHLSPVDSIHKGPETRKMFLLWRHHALSQNG